jgi:hypothetical protein
MARSESVSVAQAAESRQNRLGRLIEPYVRTRVAHSWSEANVTSNRGQSVVTRTASEPTSQVVWRERFRLAALDYGRSKGLTWHTIRQEFIPHA